MSKPDYSYPDNNTLVFKKTYQISGIDFARVKITIRGDSDCWGSYGYEPLRVYMGFVRIKKINDSYKQVNFKHALNVYYDLIDMNDGTDKHYDFYNIETYENSTTAMFVRFVNMDKFINFVSRLDNSDSFIRFLQEIKHDASKLNRKVKDRIKEGKMLKLDTDTYLTLNITPTSHKQNYITLDFKDKI